MSTSPSDTENAPTPSIIYEGHPMAKHIKQTYLGNENGATRISIPYNEEFAGNKFNKAMHLGPITAAIDSAAGISVLAANGSFEPFVTLDLRIDTLNPANKDMDIEVECQPYHREGDLFYIKGIAWQGSREYPVLSFYSAFIAANASAITLPDTKENPEKIIKAPPKPHREIITEMTFNKEAHPLCEIIPYANNMDIQVGRNELGERIVNLPFHDRHYGNPITKALQGGIFLGYMECAGAAYILDLHPELEQVKSVSVFMEYLRAPKPQDTFTRFSASKVGNRVINLDITAFQLNRGDVAKASVRYLIA